LLIFFEVILRAILPALCFTAALAAVPPPHDLYEVEVGSRECIRVEVNKPVHVFVMDHAGLDRYWQGLAGPRVGGFYSKSPILFRPKPGYYYVVIASDRWKKGRKSSYPVQQKVRVIPKP
jgi:hypothetical protein